MLIFHGITGKKQIHFRLNCPELQFNIEKIIPPEPTKPYDVRNIIKAVCDDSDFFEIQERWAANIVIGFAQDEWKYRWYSC